MAGATLLLLLLPPSPLLPRGAPGARQEYYMVSKAFLKGGCIFLGHL